MKVMLVLFPSNVAHSTLGPIIQDHGHEVTIAVDLMLGSSRMKDLGVPDCVIVHSYGSVNGLTPEQAARARVRGVQVSAGAVWLQEVVLSSYPQLEGRVVLVHSLDDGNADEWSRLQEISSDTRLRLVSWSSGVGNIMTELDRIAAMGPISQ